MVLISLTAVALLTAAPLNAADLAPDYRRVIDQPELVYRQQVYVDSSQDCMDLRITYRVPHNPQEEIVRVCGPSIF